MRDTVALTGKIRWYSFNKGYGFIKMEDNQPDVFIHANQLQRSGITRALQEGEMVKFTMDQGPKGAYATNVSLVEAQK